MNQDYNKQLMLGTQLLEKSTKFDEFDYLVYKSNFSLKLKDITNKEDYKKLVDVVVSWRYYLGIKEPISEQELEFIVKYIKDEYSHFTIEMIEIAIKSSLKGILNVDIKPYGAFSALYVSTILNAYKKYSDKVFNDVIKEKFIQERQEQNKPKEYTDEEKYLNRLKYLDYYKSVYQNGYILDFKDIMWEVLTKHNLIETYQVDKEMINRERIKAQNNLLDFGIDDETKIGRYSILRQFFEKNPDFDFKQIDIL